MRPPRFQFPNEVRSATRRMASTMVEDGTIARTSEQLDEWIEHRPDMKRSLEAEGYGTEFTADDLFPLLQVFVAQAGGVTHEPAAPPRTSPKRWVLLALLGIAVVVLVVLGMAVVARTR